TSHPAGSRRVERLVARVRKSRSRILQTYHSWPPLMKVGTTLIPDLWRMASSEAAVEWMGVLPTSAQEKTNLVERAPSGRDVGDDLFSLGRCESGPAVLV